MILYNKSFGTGHPLVILHGLFGSSDNWQTIAKSLSDKYYVILLDIRNHGLSAHTSDFNYSLIAGDISDTLDSLGIDSFYLMGHSMGGKAAAYYALNNPYKVDKLIVIDIAMRAYPPHHQRYFDAMLSLDLNIITNRIEADEWLQQFIDDFTIRQFILKNLVRIEEGSFKWRFYLHALYEHYDEINIKIQSEIPFAKPTLFVRGDKSDYIQENDFTFINQLFTHSKLVSISNAGHWVHADNPKELEEVVVGFLK